MAEYYVKTTGSDSTGDGSEGNPWASPGYAASQISALDKVWWQIGDYLCDTNSANSANSYVNLSSGSFNSEWEGYAVTPGDGGRPRFLADDSSFTGNGIFRVGNAQVVIKNVIFEQANPAYGSGVGLTGSSASGIVRAFNCDFINFAGRGASFNNLALEATGCHAAGCGSGFRGGYLNLCSAVDCVIGFETDQLTSQNPRNLCIASGCDIGYSSINNSGLTAFMSIAQGCSGDGFYLASTGNSAFLRLDSCLSIGNGGYGYAINGSNVDPQYHTLNRCVDYLNTSGRKSGTFLEDITPVTLTADPFIDPDTGDFSLNNDTGGGAVLRAILAAMPGVDTDIYPFGTWAAPVGGTSGLSRIRQGNLIGRSF